MGIEVDRRFPIKVTALDFNPVKPTGHCKRPRSSLSIFHTQKMQWTHHATNTVHRPWWSSVQNAYTGVLQWQHMVPRTWRAGFGNDTDSAVVCLRYIHLIVCFRLRLLAPWQHELHARVSLPYTSCCNIHKAVAPKKTGCSPRPAGWRPTTPWPRAEPSRSSPCPHRQWRWPPSPHGCCVLTTQEKDASATCVSSAHFRRHGDGCAKLSALP